MAELAQGMLSQVVSKAPSASQEEKLSALGEQKPQGTCEQGSVVSNFANIDAVCNRISQNTVLITASKHHDQPEEGPDPESGACTKIPQSQGEQDGRAGCLWIRTTEPGSSQSLAHQCNRIHDRSKLLLKEPSHPI